MIASVTAASLISQALTAHWAFAESSDPYFQPQTHDISASSISNYIHKKAEQFEERYMGDYIPDRFDSLRSTDGNPFNRPMQNDQIGVALPVPGSNDLTFRYATNGQTNSHDTDSKQQFYLQWNKTVDFDGWATGKRDGYKSIHRNSLDIDRCKNIENETIAGINRLSRDVVAIAEADTKVASCALPGPSLNPEEVGKAASYIAFAQSEKAYCNEARILANLEQIAPSEFIRQGGKKHLLEALANGRFIYEFNHELRDYSVKYPKSKDLESLRLLQLKLYDQYLAERPNSANLRQDFDALAQRFAMDYPKSKKSLKALNAIASASSTQPTAAELKKRRAVLESIDPTSLPDSASVRVGDRRVEKIDVATHVPYEPSMSVDLLEKIIDGKAAIRGGQCSCQVQYKGDSAPTQIGGLYAQAADDSMIRDIAGNTCVEMAKQNDQKKKPEWIAIGECKTEKMDLDPALTSALKKTVAALKEEMAKQRSAGNSSIMTDIARTIAIAIFGGMAWRARGGGFYALGSTQMARLLYATLPMTAVGYLEGGVDGAIAGALITIPLYVGWGQFQDIGRSTIDGREGQRNAEKLAMTLRGILQTSIAAAWIKKQGGNPLPLVAGGAGMGACYTMAYQWFSKTNWGPNFSVPTEFAEACSGASIFTGLALSARTLPSAQPKALSEHEAGAKMSEVMKLKAKEEEAKRNPGWSWDSDPTGNHMR